MRSTWLEMTTARRSHPLKKSADLLCVTHFRGGEFSTFFPQKKNWKCIQILFVFFLLLFLLKKTCCCSKSSLSFLFAFVYSKDDCSAKEECVKWLQKKIPFLWWQLSHTSTLVLPQLKSSIHRWWGWTWMEIWEHLCSRFIEACICLNISKQFYFTCFRGDHERPRAYLSYRPLYLRLGTKDPFA